MSQNPVPMSTAVPAWIAEAFRAAVAAAEQFRGATAPNPPVGCVLLGEDRRVLALAAHQRAGENHAEAAALDLCHRNGTTGAIRTVVVTLEPCNHWGRTPPCAEAILQTPATAVWIGTADPNPKVRGGGAARLRDAGLDVHVIEEGDPISDVCRALIAPFATRAATGRPWVTVKQAIDETGSMIPPPGQKTFTSSAALVLAHRLRKRADGILTGSGTILADDPSFTVRLVPDHPGKRRDLVILDRRGRVPGSSIEAAATRGFSVRVEQDLAEALDRLGQDGALEILVEAGPTLTASMLDAGLWDEHVLIRKGGAGETDTASVRRRGDGFSGIVPIVATDDVTVI